MHLSLRPFTALSPGFLLDPRCALLAAALALPACSLLPSSGPDRGDIRGESGQPAFTLIDISERAVAAGAAQQPQGFAARFGQRAEPAAAVIGVGDGVAVDIWEAGSDTLFSTRSVNPALSPGRNGSLPEQSVGADGTLLLPYVGRVPVLGRTAIELERQLTEALAGKTTRPQVLVHVRNHSRAVTVVGDIAGGARVPLTDKGERVLDVLAAVGGVRAPSYEARLQLTRNGETASLPLLRLLSDPRENILLQPGDILAASRQPQSFTAFGATGRNAQIEFGAESISLIEAMAKTGGLLDSRADPRGVYVLRYEPRALVASLQAPATTPGNAAEAMPVVYRLDLSEARSYFLGQRFPMRDRDIVYVSSAATNELKKLLELVGLISQPVIQGAVLQGAFK